MVNKLANRTGGFTTSQTDLNLKRNLTAGKSPARYASQAQVDTTGEPHSPDFAEDSQNNTRRSILRRRSKKKQNEAAKSYNFSYKTLF